MPISGWTDEQAARKYTMLDALPTIGVIRKGGPMRTKIKDGKEITLPGPDLDHFRLVMRPNFEHLAPAWHEIYGAEPKVLRGIFFLSNRIDDNFDTWMMERSRTRILHKCDQVSQVLWWDERTKTHSRVPRPCANFNAEPGAASRCKCQPVGELRFFMPAFTQKTRVWGKFVLRTGSAHDISNLFQTLAGSWNELGGVLAGMEFIIGRQPREITYPDKEGNRVPVTKSLLYIGPSHRTIDQVYLPMMTTMPSPAQLLSQNPIKPTRHEDLPLVNPPQEDERDESGDGWIDAEYEPMAHEEPAIDAGADLPAPHARDGLIQDLMQRTGGTHKAISYRLEQREADGTINASMSDTQVIEALGLTQQPEEPEKPEEQDALADWPDTLLEAGLTAETFKDREAPVAAWPLYDGLMAFETALDGNYDKTPDAATQKRISALLNEGLSQNETPNNQKKQARSGITTFLWDVDSVESMSMPHAVTALYWLTSRDNTLHPAAAQEMALVLAALEEEATADAEG